MKTDSFASRCSYLTALVLLSLSIQASATPAEFTGRGVFHFASTEGCPPDLMGGTTGNNAQCNRIALDLPDARASLDTEAHTIVISAYAAHDSKTVIGDVLLHGSGIASDGQRVPLSLHVLLRRSGKTWKPDTYVHSPVRGKFDDIVMPPYRISVREGSTERVLFTAKQARDVLAHPSLAARVANYFVAVRPSDAQNPSANDITIALGVGKVSKSLMRAGFTSDESTSTDLNQLLTNGSWGLKLQALSSHIPVWVVQRQLFIFGLEDSPLLQDVREHGFNKQDTLEFGARNGKGYLRYNDREEAFPGAATSGYAFMQDSFIGLILAWHRKPQAQTTAATVDTAQQSAQ
ncbi:hypothetical protein HKK52_24375 [Pseudomonas sp. ADAK2]|uniref:hypothetical protein n=1 Tax=unclassified Pseudomonas TaxID=196821 RepID=UPI0014639C44|nr:MULTISPECIES: hypothetical protein [unclassified Pseudomonas]QJI43963.1 hypothetical protein HKK53_24375 [Pseudomonas sp. ADAK7]QJI50263.1 hypothetical protein HKK52_24375 [Pseudomonas sp. ADAK2]